MFRCTSCARSIGPSIPRVTRVVEVRERAYPERRYRRRGDRKDRVDPGGVGTEIVREVPVCPRCAEDPATPFAPP